MKIAVLIARILLGLEFVVFGLNGFLHFLPMKGPDPSSVAGHFMGALMASHYMVLVFLVQLVGGILVLSGQFVPLGLTLLAPVIVNILLVHFLMLPSGIPVALFTALLWLVVFAGYRRAFAGIFARNVPVER